MRHEPRTEGDCGHDARVLPSESPSHVLEVDVVRYVRSDYVCVKVLAP